MAPEHDKLARRMTESSALSTGRAGLAELTQLEKLIARVQIRWPHPEMGDLEYLDWRESLKSSPLEKIQAALDRLMTEPPKQRQGDGSVTEYRGRPSLVDVLRTMDILAEERALETRKQRERTEREEMRKLEARRQEHPEEFFGLADVLRAANVTDASMAAKPMPNVRTVFPDIDENKNREKLERQKEFLTKSK